MHWADAGLTRKHTDGSVEQLLQLTPAAHLHTLHLIWLQELAQSLLCLDAVRAVRFAAGAGTQQNLSNSDS
jgi:hypothetical protein